MNLRDDILKNAKSLLNYTNYKLGAKYYDKSYNSNPNRPKVLDCSGFVVWAYKMAGITVPDGTWYQWENSKAIKTSDLKIGDIGIMKEGGGGAYNHVGIYAGSGYWIHCNYSKNGVTLEKTQIFNYPRRFNVWDKLEKTITQKPGKEVKNMEDNKNKNEPSPWAKSAWGKATQMKYIDGTRPHDFVTRQELAAVICRILKEMGR